MLLGCTERLNGKCLFLRLYLCSVEGMFRLGGVSRRLDEFEVTSLASVISLACN